jgi:hypothetical protein
MVHVAAVAIPGALQATTVEWEKDSSNLIGQEQEFVRGPLDVLGTSVKSRQSEGRRGPLP